MFVGRLVPIPGTKWSSNREIIPQERFLPLEKKNKATKVTFPISQQHVVLLTLSSLSELTQKLYTQIDKATRLGKHTYPSIRFIKALALI